ncbi:MAG: cupin domain-containing protein [Lactobacillales bacterium]|nr:cupin domain-containing protein [Lactobacillales bacterium]
MVESVHLAEQKPYPNNALPLLYYPKVLEDLVGEALTADAILTLFASHDYENGWINGIYDEHHFHSTAHEVLGCVSGEAEVMFGGPDGETVLFAKGDVVLIPAGVAHKLLRKTTNFLIVGTYPDQQIHDMQYGDASHYTYMLNNVENVALPKQDPVFGMAGPVQTYWHL